MGEKRKTKYSSGQGVFFPGNMAKCWGSAGSLSLSPCPEPWDFTARCHLHPLKHRTPFRLRCERGRWCFLPQWWFFLAWQCPFWTFQILPPPSILMLGGLRDAGCCFPLWLSSRSDFLLFPFPPASDISAVIKGGICLGVKQQCILLGYFLPLSTTASRYLGFSWTYRKCFIFLLSKSCF